MFFNFLNPVQMSIDAEIDTQCTAILVPLFVLHNNTKVISFKSKESIHKKEVGPYLGFGYKSLISDPIIWQKDQRNIL